ncbi:MAG: hypothetical protein E2O99_03065 [Acidobacteria bacterium]|nr:MAG: hypothetical protein E2O99_03065 [Acidobacteriota bacterium]
MRKPLSGALWGIVLGLAVAIILQQQGVWPLDKITVFLLPGAIGLIGILITSVGRAGSTRALTVSLIITIPLAVYGATGFTTLNEVGQLNGGCEVQAQTSVPDTTFVTDTSKQDPFSIDPNGSLTWEATSPVAFMDYDWDLWVEIGGFQVPLDSGHEGNEGGSQINGGNVPNVTQYADARGIDISQLRGVYKVGGQAADTCAGFGFVELIADPLETTIAKIALAVAILALIMLLIAALRKRGGTAADAGAEPAAGAMPGDTDGDGDVDADDVDGPILSNGFESGDTSSGSDDNDND